MKSIKINCLDKNWKTLLQECLRQRDRVSLENLDYTVDGEFCEALALDRGLSFKLNARGKIGIFEKRSEDA